MSTPTPTHTAVQRFRKKPVVIEAYQWLPDAPMDASVPLWYDEGCASGALYPEFDKTLSINTSEGTMRADPGDWIIRGVKGELYPCKPDIFAATYEPVSLPAPQVEQPDFTGKTLYELVGDEDEVIAWSRLGRTMKDVWRGYAVVVNCTLSALRKRASQDSRPVSVAPGGLPLPQADERDAFDAWAEDQVGPGASRRWLKTEAYENSRVQDYRTGWLACLQWASDPGDSVLPPVEPPGATLSPCAGTEPIAPADDYHEWQSVVFTLMGHASGLYAEGKRDMPAWCYGLAEKIARAHVDDAHAMRVREVATKEAAKYTSQVDRGESSSEGGES